MLDINSTDRNTFRDSEDFKYLVKEGSAMARAVGATFVPFADEKNDARDNQKKSEANQTRA